MKTAIAAIIVASFSLVVAAIGCVIAVKTYKKSKRLEFFQRRDQLFKAISDFNAKNSETRLSGARFTTIAIAHAALPSTSLYDEERKHALVASITTLATDIHSRAEVWDEQTQRCHDLCAKYNSDKHAADVEELIAIVQLGSDYIKKVNEICLSTLHILETMNPKLEADLMELYKMEMRLAELEEKEKPSMALPPA